MRGFHFSSVAGAGLAECDRVGEHRDEADRRDEERGAERDRNGVITAPPRIVISIASED